MPEDDPTTTSGQSQFPNDHLEEKGCKNCKNIRLSKLGASNAN